jgi:putative ABC transport system permease protein
MLLGSGMTIASFIVKNALRNKRRATLSILSVAVSLFLLVTLQVALRELTVPPEDIGAALRVVVRSKVSIANQLPARQRAVIQRIPGVESVSPFSWFGGKFKNEENVTFAQFAMDATLLRTIFGEAKMSAAEYEAFEKDQTGCILGKVTADKYGLKIGDRVTLTSIIYPCTLDLKIEGIYSGTIDDRNMLFHHKYLEEACGNVGWVGTWWVKVRSMEEMQAVTDAINQAFANSSAEVRAETERTFQLSFIAMWGDITFFIASISLAVGLALLFVTASTMSMAIRERLRELAVLKAVGFRLRELFMFILAESFGLAGAGAVLGVGGAWLFYTHTRLASYAIGFGGLLLLGLAGVFIKAKNWLGAGLAVLGAVGCAGMARQVYTHDSITKMTNGILLTFEVTPQIIGVGVAVAAALGLLACVAPALAVARMSVVTGLKTLD